MTETETTPLKFLYEWEEPNGVRTPELAATWARLEMWAGTECVTQLEDLGSGSTRRSVYCPLYPLAEWIAYSWWFLTADYRPASFLPSRWSFGSLALDGARRYSWLQHHNLRAAGEGFRWPNLTIVPEGRYARLVWRRDPVAPTRARIRYLTTGETAIELPLLQNTLSEFVQSVITRLTESGVNGSTLEAEWDAVQAMDAEEREFCVAAARLGLDAYAIGASVGAQIERAADELEALLLDEFLGAVNPKHIELGLEWIRAGTSTIESSAGGPNAELARLGSRGSGVVGAELSFPWDAGYAHAREVREALSIEASDPFETELMSVTEATTTDRGLEAIGGKSGGGAASLVLGRPMPEEAVRFSAARALWHLLFESERSRFLLTSAHAERQKTERAFAAELLAPAAGLRQHLRGREGDVLTEGDVDELAEHYRVSSWLVGHQIENQLAVTDWSLG